MEKEVFLIVTGNKYPKGDAGAIRQHSFAKIVNELGYKCIVVGMGNTTNFKQADFEGVAYYSLRYKKSTLMFRLLGRCAYFINIGRVLQKIASQKIKGILVVSADKPTLRRIEYFAKKNNIQLYYDSVEWYSASEFKRGEKDREYKHNDKMNRIYIDNKYKVFAISSFLENHFKNKHVNTVRIPVIMDTSSAKYAKEEHEKITIVYAGSMSAKDRIQNFISAFCNLPESDRSKFIFNIIGLTYEQYKKNVGELPSTVVNSALFFRGRISNDEVLHYLRQADFTVLLRPQDERYAKAGFPTKVVESLMMATPVICNYTSDLDQYLFDGYNAVILEDDSYDSSAKALERIQNYSREDLQKMYNQARFTAEKHFDWRGYVDIFRNFIR